MPFKLSGVPSSPEAVTIAVDKAFGFLHVAKTPQKPSPSPVRGMRLRRIVPRAVPPAKTLPAPAQKAPAPAPIPLPPQLPARKTQIVAHKVPLNAPNRQQRLTILDIEILTAAELAKLFGVVRQK